MRAVNLIPADQRRGGGGFGGRSGGAAYAVVGLIAGIAVLAVLYGTARHQIASRESEAAKLTAEAHQAEAAANALAPYTKFAALREERLKDVQQLVNTRFDWAHEMHELGRVLPRAVSLSSVTGTVGASSTTPTTPSTSTPTPASSSASATGSAATPVTSSTPPGSTPSLTISGCTSSQSEVALTMDRLRLMDGVSEVTLQSSSKGTSSASSGSASSGGSTACAYKFGLQVAFEGLPAPKSPPSRTDTTADSGK